MGKKTLILKLPGNEIQTRDHQRARFPETESKSNMTTRKFSEKALSVYFVSINILISGNLILINAKPQQNTTLTETELVKNFLTVVR